MTARQVSILMFVGLGIVAGMFAVAIFHSAITVFAFVADQGGPRWVFPVVSTLPGFLMVWLAVHLVRYRERYSDYLVTMPAPPAEPVTTAGLYPLGLSLIGILLAADAVPNLARWTAALVSYQVALHSATARSVITGAAAPAALHSHPGFADLVGALVQLAVGVGLVAARSRITALLVGPDRQPTAPPQLATCPHCGAAYSPAEYRDDADPIRCARCHGELPRL